MAGGKGAGFPAIGTHEKCILFASPLVNVTFPDLKWTYLYGRFLIIHRCNPYFKLLKVSTYTPP